MSRAAWLCAAALVMLAGAVGAAPATASAAVSEAFAAGTREFGAGDWLQALAHFHRARDAGMEGPAVLYNIGVCQYRLGRYEDAETTFRTLAERFPAMAPLATYNAGLALVKRERYAEAQAAFTRAASSGDSTVAGLAGAMLDRLAGRGGPAPATVSAPTWNGFVNVAAGHDDNVVLLDDSILPAGESTGSAFGQVFGRLSRRPAGGDGWQAAVSGYLVRYPDAERFDQNVFRLGAGWRWSWRDWRLDAGPHFSWSSLDGGGFERRIGATLGLARDFGRDGEFSARMAHEEISELEPQFAFVDGSREMLELRVERRAGAGRLVLEYEFTFDDRSAASVSPMRHEFSAGYRRWIDENWSAGAEMSLRASRYDDLSVPRDEDRTELTLTLARSLPAGWQLAGQYRLSSNDSNVDGFSYDRNRFGIGLNRVFQ